MPRPTKLTQKVTLIDEQGKESKVTVGDAVVAYIERGAYKEDAARAAGISDTTFHNWIARGREHEGADSIPERERPFVAFVAAIEKAESAARVVALDAIRKAWQGGTWQAAAWYLERTQPTKYGRRIHVKDDAPRTPAPIGAEQVARYEERFRETYADELGDLDPANLMPSLTDPGDVDAESNGHRNGSG